MSAVVIDFATAAARMKPRAVALRMPAPALHPALSHDFTFWQGASGARYVHTIYALLECPDLPKANVVLVRRHANGHAEVLYVGRLEQEATSVNLAEVRRTAAVIGANEVHVHLLAGTADVRREIERDIASTSEMATSGLGTRH